MAAPPPPQAAPAQAQQAPLADTPAQAVSGAGGRDAQLGAALCAALCSSNSDVPAAQQHTPQSFLHTLQLWCLAGRSPLMRQEVPSL